MGQCEMYVFNDENRPKTSDSKQEYFLRRAACIASRSSMNHRHGCVIVNKNGDIVAEGYNYVYTHMHHKFSIHAEVCCLSKMKRNKKWLSDCDMYVVRVGTENMGNPLKYSRPCEGCTEAIIKAGIKRVYYSTSDEFYCKIESFRF